jgi:hypothetical protein
MTVALESWVLLFDHTFVPIELDQYRCNRRVADDRGFLRTACRVLALRGKEPPA